MRFLVVAFSLLVAGDLAAQVTVVLTATPASPVSRGQPIGLTAVLPGQPARPKGREVRVYTFTAQRLAPCPQNLTIAADSPHNAVSWTPPTAGQYSLKVSTRTTAPLQRERLTSNPVVVSVEERIQLHPLEITAVNAAEGIFRVTASLEDAGFPASYTFKFADRRPAPEINGSFNDAALALATWITVANTTVTSTSPKASWEVTLPPKHHDLKVELLRQRSSDCDTATGTLEQRYVVPLSPP